jgi:Holliday junction resolvase RusA-like endonuclease
MVVINMRNYFVIDDKLPSLNDYIDVCRRNKYNGAKFKKDVENLILIYIRNAKVKKLLTPTDKPVVVHFEWHEKTKRRDADNVASAKKYILDAMQKAGIIPNDNRKYVKGFTDVIIDDKKDYVVVKIEEVEV